MNTQMKHLIFVVVYVSDNTKDSSLCPVDMTLCMLVCLQAHPRAREALLQYETVGLLELDPLNR
jgi:hypothetical protein